MAARWWWRGGGAWWWRQRVGWWRQGARACSPRVQEWSVWISECELNFAKQPDLALGKAAVCGVQD